jgi:hypothetical protein
VPGLASGPAPQHCSSRPGRVLASVQATVPVAVGHPWIGRGALLAQVAEAVAVEVLGSVREAVTVGIRTAGIGQTVAAFEAVTEAVVVAVAGRDRTGNEEQDRRGHEGRGEDTASHRRHEWLHGKVLGTTTLERPAGRADLPLGWGAPMTLGSPFGDDRVHRARASGQAQSTASCTCVDNGRLAWGARRSRMHRRTIPVTVALTVLALMALGSPGVAKEAKKAAVHPVVGAWLLDTDVQVPDNPPATAMFSSDGTYIQTDGTGTAIGAWKPTGPSTADLTFIFYPSDSSGLTGTLRASIEVSEDGQALTATYTGEFVAPDGTSTQELGPGTAAGTRLAVEPMGTPVGPLTPPEPPSAGPSASPAA